MILLCDRAVGAEATEGGAIKRNNCTARFTPLSSGVFARSQVLIVSVHKPLGGLFWLFTLVCCFSAVFVNGWVGFNVKPVHHANSVP